VPDYEQALRFLSSFYEPRSPHGVETGVGQVANLSYKQPIFEVADLSVTEGAKQSPLLIPGPLAGHVNGDEDRVNPVLDDLHPLVDQPRP